MFLRNDKPKAPSAPSVGAPKPSSHDDFWSQKAPAASSRTILPPRSLGAPVPTDPSVALDRLSMDRIGPDRLSVKRHEGIIRSPGPETMEDIQKRNMERAQQAADFLGIKAKIDPQSFAVVNGSGISGGPVALKGADGKPKLFWVSVTDRDDSPNGAQAMHGLIASERDPRTKQAMLGQPQAWSALITPIKVDNVNGTLRIATDGGTPPATPIPKAVIASIRQDPAASPQDQCLKRVEFAEKWAQMVAAGRQTSLDPSSAKEMSVVQARITNEIKAMRA